VLQHGANRRQYLCRGIFQYRSAADGVVENATPVPIKSGRSPSLIVRWIAALGPGGWIKPQLTRLVDQAPDGPDWLHEIKFDGYRMHARLDRGAVRLLTRTGLDWTHKYPAIAAAVASLPARQAYLDGELCGVRPDGTTSFSLIQNASDTESTMRSSSSSPITSRVCADRCPGKASSQPPAEPIAQ
jgi:hypothetical protein